MLRHQAPSLILPTAYAAGTGELTDTELIADGAVHTSAEIETKYLEEIVVHILAVEIVFAGVPGNLDVWIEMSPYPTANSTRWPAPYPASAMYWAARGGGGGFLPPVAPEITIAGTGVNLTPHGGYFPCPDYTYFARVCCQTLAPVATAFWTVQILISGRD